MAVRSFDILFNYLHDPVGQVRSNLLLAGARQVVSGCPLIKRGHAVPFLLEPLQALAIYETDLVPVLSFPSDRLLAGRARLRANGIQGKPVVVHPGSGSPAKNWPVERFADVIRRLRAQQKEVVAVAGEADVEQAAVLAREVPGVPLLTGLTLTELSETLAECGCFLGNDSGITHLAAAVGLPVVALFGPSDPDTWAPRGRGGVRIVRAQEKELERLETSAVWEEMKHSSFF